MLENLQSTLQNRNKSWATIAYMTVVFQDGNENVMASFRGFFFAVTLSNVRLIPGGPKVT